MNNSLKSLPSCGGGRNNFPFKNNILHARISFRFATLHILSCHRSRSTILWRLDGRWERIESKDGRTSPTTSRNEKMGGPFDASESTISPMIENHRRARTQRAALEQRGWLVRSLLCFPLLICVRWRERRALAKLVAIVPLTAEDARCKLTYVMANMIADRSTGPMEDVATVTETLRSHKDSLTRFLRK